MQDKTVLNRTYVFIQDTVVREQKGCRSFIKLRNKTDPWGTPDNTGTVSNLDHLILPVECAQRAMS